MLASVEAEAAAGHPDEVTFELPPPENDIYILKFEDFMRRYP